MGRKTTTFTLTVRGLLAVAALRFVSWLPLSWVRAFGAFAATLIWWCRGNDRRIAEINLKLCFPSMPDSERRALARQALTATTRTMAELGWVWLRPRDAQALTRGNIPQFQAALDGDRPVVILAPHLGNWEVLNFWLSEHAHMHALYMPSGIERFDNLVQRSRESLGNTVHPATLRGVASLMRAMKKKHEITGILPDQVPERNNGRFADFYGHPAWTGPLPVRLIQETNAIAFMAFAKRLPDGHFQIIMQEPDEDIYSDDVDTALAAMNRSIEKLIALAPEQYLWSYKRFRRSPGIY